LIMFGTDRLFDEIAEATERVRSASARLKGLSPDAPEYQSAMVAYGRRLPCFPPGAESYHDLALFLARKAVKTGLFKLRYYKFL